MPLYVYKAVDKNGQVIKNKVEEVSKFVLANRLKENGYTPIKVNEVQGITSKKKKKSKKNIETSGSVLKEIRQKEKASEVSNKKSILKKQGNQIIIGNVKILTRDIVAFTQDLYSLKKAGFNNIHALSVIIENTSNPTFKEVIEDILLGVEAGESMYSTMEYYDNVFPSIYVNIIKVGEQSRITYKCIRASNKILRR